MEKPTYNPQRAQEIRTFLEGLSPLELRWTQHECGEVLDHKVEVLRSAYHEAQSASYAYVGHIHWTADGRLENKAVYSDAEPPVDVEQEMPL